MNWTTTAHGTQQAIRDGIRYTVRWGGHLTAARGAWTLATDVIVPTKQDATTAAQQCHGDTALTWEQRPTRSGGVALCATTDDHQYLAHPNGILFIFTIKHWEEIYTAKAATQAGARSVAESLTF